jgi:adenosylhomocysteinase
LNRGHGYTRWTRVRRFFDAVNARFACARDVTCFVVTHILPDRPFFLAALGSLAQLGVVLAKPRSIDGRTKDWLAHRRPLIVLRERFTDQSTDLELASRFGSHRPLILLDIGGYFAPLVNTLAAGYAGGLIGTIEDTENGIQRYEREPSLACPVISVARSPLKNPEDFLVGQSIVYSVEALLRQQGDILHGRTACVIGYDKLGRSIANLLHARHVRTVVFDVDAVRQIEAMSHGFSIAHRLDRALRGAGLVFCATRNIALKREAFALLDSAAYVATVTSSDDELEIGDLHRDYRMKQVTDFLTAYSKGGRISIS